MQPSKRIRAIFDGGSDGWEILGKARARERAGAPVLNLTIGEHEDPTPPRFVEAMAEAARAGATRYSAFTGTPELRAAIAARAASRTGWPTRPEQVIVTAGGQAALLAAFLATLDPGDPIVFVDPYYATYPGTIRVVQGEPRPVPALPDAGFQPDLEAMAEACRGAKALMINSPHNPTGAVYTSETLEAVRRIVLENDLWLISDEVYDGMVWRGEHLSPRALPDMAERTIVIGSVSKSHAMTGFRLGWAVGPEEIVDLMGDYALNATYGLPGFIQQAGLFALTEGGEEEADLMATFRRRRDLAVARLSGRNGLKLAAPDGAMYVMLDIRGTGMSGEAFAEALLEAEDIAVMPGESFGDAAAGHLRVALTVPDETLGDALERIADFAEGRLAA
ncbi:MAG: aminotransferase class I/II-fold pyridoxal phosphate-dependent enzyme [Pseudomonadota bacterium]